MVGETIDFNTKADNRDELAIIVSNTWDKWNQARQPWLQEVQEIRNYVFATDTTTTTNKTLPWKNSTTLPKLCQIRDNLHAFYMAALFPHADWLTWEGNDADAEQADKRQTIISYMNNKVKQVNFRAFFSNLIYDWIDYGNLFCTAEWERDVDIDPIDGSQLVNFIGARPKRISPLDIVFNPAAVDFKKTPKVIRSLVSLGEIKKAAEDENATEYDRKLSQYAIERLLETRKYHTGMSQDDKVKTDAFSVDGFGTLSEYYGSGYVEVLQCYGTLYDTDAGILYDNHVVTVVDRSFVLSKDKIPSWLNNGIKHVGWRTRPDNLYAMSPLSNLVGMQYRIDHLENLKADVFDMIAFPVFKIMGSSVEEFDYAPNERIYCGDEGDVQLMHPDVTALNADVQIRELENRMEEMAGSPSQSMGIRTAGEKTAYEVQTLENNASRVGISKASYLEEMALEPLLNLMLELARHNMSESDLIRTLDSEINVVTFSKITREDIKASGKLRPTGAAHFARKANLVQNLTNLAGSALYQDPTVNTHISGLKMAKLLERLLDLDKYDIVSENIRITEQAETQRLFQAAGQQLEIEAQTPAGINPAEQMIGN